MQHEFVHILQYRKIGAYAYWHVIAPESFASASRSQAILLAQLQGIAPKSLANINPYELHHNYWTENMGQLSV